LTAAMQIVANRARLTAIERRPSLIVMLVMNQYFTTGIS
jgi:hypothetical protein